MIEYMSSRNSSTWSWRCNWWRFKKVYENVLSAKIVAIGEIDLIITMIILQEKTKRNL